MKRIIPVIQIITGLLLVLLIVNDFSELLFEYLFNVSKVKIPIEWSDAGWDFKYWMIDNPPVFGIYQVAFFAGGLLLMLSALFQFTPSIVNLGVVGGLGASALLVLLAPNLNELVSQTPKEFMYAQLIAAAGLLPAALKKQNLFLTQQVSIWVGAVLCATLLAIALLKTPITLTYAIWPVLGIAFLFIFKKRYAA